MVKTIETLFANDQWMTTGWIRRESSFALYLFMWVNTILEYIGVAMKLKGLGLKEIEERRDAFLSMRD